MDYFVSTQQATGQKEYNKICNYFFHGQCLRTKLWSNLCFYLSPLQKLQPQPIQRAKQRTEPKQSDDSKKKQKNEYKPFWVSLWGL